MKKGFTLVETLIVVIIAGILLSMTFNLGWDYIQFLRFKQDREAFVNLIDKTIVRTRATNYYDGVKYTYLDLFIRDDGLDVMYGTGDPTDVRTCGAGTVLDTYDLVETVLSGHTDTNIRIVPFGIECDMVNNSYGDDTNICAGANTTGLDLRMSSLISDDETCYRFDYTVCKFILTNCP